MNRSAGKNNPNYRHGGHCENAKEYNSWRAMRERCNNPRHRAYKRYGGRGIKVCERWNNPDTGFINFLSDMGRRPDGMTIDRINNDKGYSPQNCRWSDQKTQVANSSKKFSAIVTAETMKNANCSQSLVYKRIRAGWGVEQALYTFPENHYQKRHLEALSKHRKCPICGKQCPTARSKFCSMNCFRESRKPDGRFGGIKYEQDKKEAFTP